MEVPLKMTINNLKLLHQRLNLLVHSALNQLNSIAVLIICTNHRQTLITQLSLGSKKERHKYHDNFDANWCELHSN